MKPQIYPTCVKCGAVGIKINGIFYPSPHVTACHISPDMADMYEEKVCPNCKNHYVVETEKKRKFMNG